MTNRIRNIFFSALTLSLILPVCCFAESFQRKFRLGFIAPLSGPAQVYGDAAKNGFELALSELGRAEPGRDWIEVIYEDDEFKPAKSVAAFHKLISTDKVDAIVCVASTPCNAVAPLAQQRGVPLVAWASDTKVSRNRPFVIRSYPSGADEGREVAEEAIRRKADNVAVTISTNDYSESWRQGFIEWFPENKILMNEEVPNDSKDFRAIILRAAARKVSQFAICLDPGQSAAFARQAAQVVLNMKIFGCESLHATSEIDAAGGALDSAWFATISVTDEFHRKYVERFGNDSVISAGANHYDLAYLLHSASTSAGTEDFISRLLTGAEHQGAVGKFRVVESAGDQYFDVELQIKAARVVR